MALREDERGWAREFPKVEGFYCARRSQTDRPSHTIIDVWRDGGEWFVHRFGDSRQIEAKMFIDSLYEYLGPFTVADFERLAQRNKQEGS